MPATAKRPLRAGPLPRPQAGRHSLIWSLLVAVLMLALLLVLATDVASACPSCKQGIAENSGEQSQIVEGYFYSILFMMGMPFLILGTFGSCMYVSVRKARRREAEL